MKLRCKKGEGNTMTNIIESGDPILQEDLEIIANSKINVEELRDSSILITGATGLVGMQLVKAIACCNRICQLNLKIYGLVRDEKKAEKIYGNLLNREDLKLVVGDVTDDFEKYITEDQKIDYIIHSASITSSKIMIKSPVDTIITSVKGTDNMLRLAKEKACKSFVYISSMEMYGKIQNLNGEKVTEDKNGYLDPLAVRSNYPESKRLCENLCIAYSSQYGVPIKIARLAQTFGAGILENENRVFAQFARSVIENKDIVLHTKGESEGNYCYLRDTIKALIILLTKGEVGNAYNITNEHNHVTIAEMAELVCSRIANNRIKVVFDIPENNIYGYATDTKMWLSATKMKELGWKAEVGLEESYLRMIKSMEYNLHQ